ncbi:hypothetical protein EYW98_16735 [Escherichia coli]|nr:hypothetical protein [Escherichia coli]EGO8378669.1 hypothetical protein [Escherichia coli]
MILPWPGTKTQMTIRSKTYKGGGFNELCSEDATDSEQVYMHAQKDMVTEVLHDRTTRERSSCAVGAKMQNGTFCM